MFYIYYFTLEFLAKWDPKPFCRTKCGAENFPDYFCRRLAAEWRITMNAYNTYSYRRTVKRRGVVSRLLRAIFEVVCERLCSVEARIALVAIGFLLTLGLVGGMESGALPMYIGMPVCLVLAIAGLLINLDD